MGHLFYIKTDLSLSLFLLDLCFQHPGVMPTVSTRGLPHTAQLPEQGPGLDCHNNHAKWTLTTPLLKLCILSTPLIYLGGRFSAQLKFRFDEVPACFFFFSFWSWNEGQVWLEIIHRCAGALPCKRKRDEASPTLQASSGDRRKQGGGGAPSPSHSCGEQHTHTHPRALCNSPELNLAMRL